MISLPSLLSALVTTLQAHPLCQKVSVIETTEFSNDQFFLKVSTDLIGKYKLQARIYYNRGHVDYAYQLFTDGPLLRWDNKEEFNYLDTYPHHYHDEQGNVYSSPLVGDTIKNIEIVLNEVVGFLENKPGKEKKGIG